MDKNEKLVAVRMPESLLAILDSISEIEDLTRSSLIRKSMRNYLYNFLKDVPLEDEERNKRLVQIFRK